MQYARHTDLPEPDEASARHSRRVFDYVADRIADGGGSISFAEYMHHALYTPGLGYYAAGTTKFGDAGDFVTAPEISGVFGRVVARQCAEVMAQLDRGAILEFGAGSGKLAADVLTMLHELDALPERYRILEVSPDLCDRQQAFLQERVPQFTDRVEWLSELPATHSGVVLANEVLDALPVERFIREEDGILQQCVTVGERGFEFETRAAPDVLRTAVCHVEDSLGHRLAHGYTSEVSLGIGPWISELGGCLDAGCVLLFDYGGTRREYFAADRGNGWLRCHFRHRAHSDPLVLTGIQDITAWVEFTALAEAAVNAGFEVAGYVPQSLFLAAGGLDQEMQDVALLSANQQLALSAQIKTLTLPGEMGENIKCIGLLKGSLRGPPAFGLGDRTHTL